MMKTETYMVAGKYPLALLPGLEGGHFAWLKTVSRKNPDAFQRLLVGLPRGMSVVEYFGGVGIFSTIIQQELKPRTHLAFDLDPDCARQLATIPGVQAAQGDAKELMGRHKAQLVVLDFPGHTARSHDDWNMGAAFARKPRYVLFSDTALRRLGLHRKLYTEHFGRTIHTQADYMTAYSLFLRARYGYAITRVAHHVYSYVRAEPVEYATKLITIERV